MLWRGWQSNPLVRVPDEERVCPVCGKDKQVIGHLVSEVLLFRLLGLGAAGQAGA